MVKKIVALYRQAYSGLPREAWFLAFIELVNRSGTMVLFFLTIYLTRRLNFTLPRAGQMMSLYGFGSLIGAYLGGHFCDRLGASNIQRLSLFLSGVLLIWLRFLTSFAALAVIICLYGVANSALYPANATAMAASCPPGPLRTKGVALNRLASNLGVTIGPVVGGFLAQRSYHLIFWVDGLTSLAAAFLFWFFSRRLRFSTPRPRHAAAPTTPLRRDHFFLAILGLIFLMGIVFVQIFSTFPLYVRNVYGLVESRIGQLLAVNTLMIVLLEMPLMEKLKNRLRQRVIALGAILLGGGFALMPLGSGFGYAVLTVMVWSSGEILSMPMLGGLVADHASERNRGRYLGLFGLSFALASMIGPVCGMWVYEHLGPAALWLGCGAVAGAAALGFMRLAKNKAAKKFGTDPMPGV